MSNNNRNNRTALMMKKLLLLLIGCLACMATGCRTTLTNLTPSQQPRSTTGLYPFEVMWNTSQYSIREDTVQAYVLTGTESYPMSRTPQLTNRWEAFVPVPSDKNVINYRFKFDYQYLSIPNRRDNSKLSPQYQLRIGNP
jgi:hypothetical protein